MRWGEREGWSIPIPSPPWFSNFTACRQKSPIHNMKRSSSCVRVESSGMHYTRWYHTQRTASMLGNSRYCVFVVVVGIVGQVQFVVTQHVYEQSPSLAPTNGKNTINKRNSFVAGSVQIAGTTRSSHALREKKKITAYCDTKVMLSVSLSHSRRTQLTLRQGITSRPPQLAANNEVSYCSYTTDT